MTTTSAASRPTRDDMHDGLASAMRRSTDAYAALDLGPVPFPAESVRFWSYMWALQGARNPDGGYLEVGVEHGGTAFFSMCGTAEHAPIDLVDVQRTDRFSSKFEQLSETRRANTRYHQMSSFALDVEALRHNDYSVIHIDGGHLHEHVVKDMTNLAPLMGEESIMVLDDVFETRWPGVTQAVFEMLSTLPLKPLFFVNRKLYVVPADGHRRRMDEATESLAVLERFSDLRCWKVDLLGSELYTLKMSGIR